MKHCYFILLLSIIFILCCIYKKTTESFISKSSKYHQCPPFTQVLKAHKSFKGLSKAWCSKLDDEDAGFDDSLFSIENTKLKKCPSNYSRSNAKDSYNKKSKAWCEKPTDY